MGNGEWELGAEVGDALDVLGLGEHVVRHEAAEAIAALGAEDFQVASHGGGMAGDVDDLRGL